MSYILDLCSLINDINFLINFSMLSLNILHARNTFLCHNLSVHPLLVAQARGEKGTCYFCSLTVLCLVVQLTGFCRGGRWKVEKNGVFQGEFGSEQGRI